MRWALDVRETNEKWALNGRGRDLQSFGQFAENTCLEMSQQPMETSHHHFIRNLHPVVTLVPPSTEREREREREPRERKREREPRERT